MPITAKKNGSVRTTVSIPERLYQDAKAMAEERSDARNLNSFFVNAIQAYVEFLKRRQIDAAFRQMSADETYQADARSMAAEFAASDWEAFQTAEKSEL